MLTCYLSSPNTQQQAHSANGCPVLLSFAFQPKWIERYIPSFDRVLVDSGAFSELNTGTKIDRDEYAEHSQRMLGLSHVDAAATLDDISGDWKRGLDNWDAMPWTFPVFHDSDPPEALDAILERLEDQDRPRWIGLGMVPPRTSGDWLVDALRRIEDRMPELNVHGFALRRYLPDLLAYRGKSVSVDSTNWMLDVRQLLANPLTGHLTPAECLDVIVKRYQRDGRYLTRDQPRQEALF